MSDLFPNEIPRYERGTALDRVPVLCGSDASYALTGDERRWVRKTEAYTGFQSLLAEAVSWLLGRSLGVPMPDAAVVDIGNDDERAWLSAALPDVHHWKEDKSHLVENYEELGRFLALDAIIFNEDRHRGNILLQVLDEQSLRGWIIDCGDALVGQPADFPALGAKEVPSAVNIAPGLPVVLMESGALLAAADAEQLDEDRITDFVREACEIARSSDDVEAIAAQLVLRCSRAVELTTRLIDNIQTVYTKP